MRLQARRVPPWYVEQTVDGRTMVIDSLGDPVAELFGMWTSDMVNHLQAYRRDSLVVLGELLWRIGGYGGGDDVRRMAEKFIETLQLDD